MLAYMHVVIPMRTLSKACLRHQEVAKYGNRGFVPREGELG